MDRTVREVKSECHICRETVETSQLIHCMQCAMVLCKECDIDHRDVCATDVVIVRDNLPKPLMQKTLELLHPTRHVIVTVDGINQVIGQFNRAPRSVS